MTSRPPPGYRLADRLDAFAEKRGFKPLDPYYIAGEFSIRGDPLTLYSDEAHLWCVTCATALLALARPHLKRQDDHFVSLADASTGEDAPSHCRNCGATLDHVLTAHGVEEEIEHYDSCPLTAVSAGEAWCIARIVEAAPARKAALALARRALKAIRDGRIRP
jgi:hypothetical protein